MQGGGSVLKKPSEFIKERSLSIEERLLQASHLVQQPPRIVELVGDIDSAAKVSHVPIGRPLFEPLPSDIILQSYEPFQEYEIVVSFRNRDKFARRLKIEPINHPHFTITGMNNDSLHSGKVAPGMDIQFLLKFNPEERIDYMYNMVCVTEREKFLVPIRAYGARGILDFPDNIAFSDCPVKYSTTKTLFVRNIGNRPAKFTIDVETPFEASPSRGYLDVKQNMQIDIHFNPDTVGSFEKNLLIKYDTGEIVTVSLMGNAEDANIRLEKTSLKLDSTYITLTSSKTIRIFNRSDIMAKFAWKMFPTALEDRQHRLKLKFEEDRLEELECLKFHQDLKANQTLELCDLAPLIQKYRNKRREIENDPLLYDNDVFIVQPVQGIIWPNSHVDIAIVFSPKAAGNNAASAFCEVSGRQSRLPLTLKGDGIGPKARFSYELLDVEQIFINTVHQYEAIIENRGDIDFKYSLIKSDSLFGPKFQFFPEKGTLKVGEQQVIRIQFNSDILGSFSEYFSWHLEGAPENLTIGFKGQVVGPTFHFESPELNFGNLAYGFMSSKTCRIINTSHISMAFNIRIPYETSDKMPEFTITPSSGTIPPLGVSEIRVDFIPRFIKKYEEWLIVDVDAVGEDLQRLPIFAESIVPEISLRTPLLDYGDCFIVYPYQQHVELVNETDFPAKFELLLQEESAKNVYSYTSNCGSGIILPHTSQKIQIEIQIKRLGHIHFPIFIKIFGNEDIPLSIDISAQGIGPNVVLSTNELNWGKIQVLKDVTSSLTLTNQSSIIANFTCATVSDSSVFCVEPLGGSIAPGQSVEIHVTAFLDDTLKFTDILKIGVQSDGIHEVQLVAKGQGTTIIFDEALKNVDFQDVFSNRECSKEFVLVNKGRRTQTLHWSAEEDRFARKDAAAALNQVFEVFPSRFSLKPNGQQIILVKGYSNKAFKAKETLLCQGTIDKDPARRILIEASVSANFVNPLLEMSPSILRFISSHTRDDDFELISHDLTLRNVSSLPLQISFKCPIPYSIEPSGIEYRLNQGESVDVVVNYDPKYNTSRVSCKEHAKLLISYSEHPQKDYIELFSEITFPNLTFSLNSLDFGCIPVETENKKSFILQNHSSLPVEYSWSFLEGTSKYKNCVEDVPIYQVFDILPLRSYLQPGESEVVEVTFYGHMGGAFTVTAQCDVIGGPKYEFKLHGEASLIEYTFDKLNLDFGTLLYQDIKELDLTLTNSGLVVFDFSTIILPNSTLAQKIVVSPSTGSISPHGKQKISVRFCACVPEHIDDCFYIQLALFEPIKIRVTGTGIFPQIQMNVPRALDEKFDLAMNDAKLFLSKSKKKNSPRTEYTDLEIETEAERLLLRSKTITFLAGMSEDIRLKTAVVPKSKMMGSPILIFKNLQKQAKERGGHSSNLAETSQVLLSTYVCSFGNVIRQTSRKKTVKITNRSLGAISFQLDKSILVGTGFSIEPDRVKSLPGHPHYESVDFVVSFQARHQTVGPVHIDLPINIQGGPTTILSLRADVTVPELQLSSQDVEFGEVLCGLRKTITIQLWNSNSVPCEWTSQYNEVPTLSGAAPQKNSASKKKAGTSSLKEFELVPAFGTLQPGEKMLLEIRFSPVDEKEYDTIIPLKINMNNQISPLHLNGKGAKPTIVFEPESLSLGPILPCSDGIEAKFSIYNPTNLPIEVYSVDFDHVHLEEEDILRNIDGYENNMIYISPRGPGQSLPDYIIDMANQKREKKMMNLSSLELSSANSKNLPYENNGVGEVFETASKTLKSPSSACNETANSEQGCNIILHGPPFSGRTTQARKIHKSFGYAYIKIDEIIEAAKDSDFSSLRDNLKISERDESAASTRRVSTADEANKSGNNLAFDLTEEDTKHLFLSDDVIASIIRARIHKEDCMRGVIIDGIETKYSSNPISLLRTILKALGDRRKTIFIHLTADSSTIREREAIVLKRNRELDFDPAFVRDITEEEYDNMTDAEKEIYDSSVLRHKKRLKELQDRRRLEKKQFEEEMAMRVGERKVEEEVTKGNKKKAPNQVRGPSRAGAPSEKQDKVTPATMSKNEKPSVKAEKGNLSPKTTRKNQQEKSNDKNELKVEGRNDADDFSSKLNLSEVGEFFLSDLTYKRLEFYSTNIDNILSIVRDGERGTIRHLSSAATVEKKSGKGKNVNANLSTLMNDVPVPSINTVDSEPHTADEASGIIFKELNGSHDEETLFKAMSESFPTSSKPDDGVSISNLIPKPFLEQIVIFPHEREAQIQLKNFQLQPLQSLDADDESAAENAAIITATNSSNKKGRATAIKISEDIKQTELEDESEKDSPSRYRWIIQPKDKKELTLKFNSNEIGKFEQTLQFEILGSKTKYSLPVIGLCRYSQILSEYKKIFPKWKKSKEDRYIPHGEFIVNTSTYEFGPLLYSKPREKYLERFPENCASLNITNPSAQEIKVSICLRNDIKSEVFFFDPPAMDLAPGQTQILQIWAYPRSANYFEDTLIICIKDNPEPYCYKISCIGVKPEIEIDKRQLSFDKLLIGRSEKRELKLRNGTLMPVAWKLAQIEVLGDEFTVSPVEGIIEPFQEQIVTAEFRGSKPVVISRRSIRLEVSDHEKIGGVVQEIPILVTAEAYDIAMDLHFPKGYDGGLDFGVFKVMEEGKQLCTLKNKGKYEVGFRFVFESKELSTIFSVSPQQGIMQPSDKPFPVQVIFKANRELVIKDSTNLKCQFFEPTTGEVTATIPVKLLARSVFSKFSILPARDLNFGSLIHGAKVSKQFTVENMGEFDFRYSIYKSTQALAELKIANNAGKGRQIPSRMSKATNGRPASPPPPVPVAQAVASVTVSSNAAPLPAQINKPPTKKDTVKQADASNFGAFTVFPTNGVIPAGTKHQITVEFHSEIPGSYEEIVAIDISDRSPNDYDVLEYRLVGETCIPGINTSDFASIFEEQTVCKRLELFNTQGNVYAEEDRVFYFGAYLAGQQVQVRFKISNPFKVPCDVSIITKPRSRTKSDAADFAFDVEPKKLTIASHEYKYVTVSFHPTSIQSYAGIFEALVENIDQSKAKTLTFELRGEGTLPRVSVEKPIIKTKNGTPLLKFKRLLVGSTQILPIVLKNEGITTAKVKLEWVSKEIEEFNCNGIDTYHTLRPQESRSIDIKCRAASVKKFEADIKVRVLDNSFEDTIIQLSGEGYLDELTFDNLPNEAENELSMGDCFIGEQKDVTFTVTNHSTDVMRISWAIDSNDLIFSPSVAHIKSNGQKEFTVSFIAKQPIELNQVRALCKMSKIKYLNQSIEADWDDKAKSIRWIMNETKSLGPRKIVEQYPEPAFDTLLQNNNEHSLSVSAFADYSMYDCDINQIKFKNTLMYQTRVFRFNLRNPGKVILKYSFILYNEESQEVEQSSEDCPFSISPSSGIVEPGENIMVTVRFSPLEDGSYTFTALCAMNNLTKDAKPLAIQIQGCSLRPFCHFELEESDYITSDRRSPDTGLPTVLPQNTRVIEFESCGVKVKNTKRFYIVNPTNINYEFEWTPDRANDQKIFKCSTTKGLVLSNKKFEMIFEFIPETVELKESLWKFTILNHNISIPFLLVGKALEPNIYMDRVSINFKSILVGRQVKETVKLVNNESIPFAFSFNETSFELGNDGSPVLRFSPTSGTIGGHSEIPIDISFTPSSEKAFNFNLICNVKKKPTPVTINIKGEGYEIHESLQTEMVDGTIFELASGHLAENNIDFGQVQLNEKRLKRITLVNSGKFNFDFAWKFLSKMGGAVSINPDIGTVPKGERIVCEVIFLPTTNVTLKNVKALCQIVNGNSYPLTILGSGCKPQVKFSSTVHDFGCQFIYKPGMTILPSKIVITNCDIREISIDIPYRESTIFDIQRNVTSLAPGESTELELYFYPRESRLYNEIIKVEINGLSTIDLNLIGSGTEFKVDLLQSDLKSINFGALRVGHTVSRNVKFINRSAIPATFSLGPISSIESLVNHSVTISPIGDYTLRPKGILNVEFKFLPQNRIPPFSEEISIEAPGLSQPLFLVSGACQGIEIRLENDTLPFGAVVQKSCTTRRIQLQNTGDIGAKFHWDISKFSPDFTIAPPEGYISPGMDIPLEITFHPMDLNQDIRYEGLTCNIEGMQPLYLTLTGMCIPQPLQNDALKFATPVRQSDVKSIKLENKTSSAWRIRPIIENDSWSGPEVFDIEPGQTKSYDISFTPFDTIGAGDGGRHEGSIFFPLPDGSGLLYKLYGIADKPLSAGSINREIPCKTSYTEILPVYNWLKRAQRFKVLIELAKPDPSVIIKGLDFVDVPPLLTRDFKLNFYSFKEGITNVKVTFRNDLTQEFIHYNVTFKSTPPGVISTYELTTSVRQLLTKEISLTNPLPTPVSFNASCTHSEISATHSFIIQPRSEGVCLIEYLPLTPKESIARLNITSNELGTYQYDLRLISTPAGPDRSLHFKIGLGGSQMQTVRLLSYAKVKTEYTCKIDSPDFFVEKSVVAPSSVSSSGTEIAIDVMYEPSKLGDIRTQLTVSSPSGGDYICPLYGHCTSPRPQGPITIKAGSSTSVPFKNVFSTQTTFNFVVDNPAFSVKAQDTIGPKKSVVMLITALSTSSSADPKASKVGKLTVTQKGGSNVSWIYYLKQS